MHTSWWSSTPVSLNSFCSPAFKRLDGMFSKLVPSLVVLSVRLIGSYAAPSGDGLSYALSRAGLDTSGIATAVVLGSDSSGHTSYSISFAQPFTTASTATAPDATFTAEATLVEGSTDAHLFELETQGPNVATFNEDCALSNSYVVCTLVGGETAVLISTVVTVTLSASTSPVATASPSSKNGAARVVGVAGASVLSVLAAGVMLASAMV